MSFNEITEHRFDIKESCFIEKKFPHLDEDNAKSMLINAYKKYSSFLSEDFTLPINSTYKQALYLLLKALMSSKKEYFDYYIVDFDGSFYKEQEGIHNHNLGWIPIRPFLQFRHKKVFGPICFMFNQLLNYCDGNECGYRNSEHEYCNEIIDDPLGYEVDQFVKAKENRLYNHYISFFKECNEVYSRDEAIELCKEDYPEMIDFFHTFFDFLENPSHVNEYDGYVVPDEECCITASNRFNIIWDYESYLDKDIRYHISDSGNNFGCSNIAYKVPYEKDECKESEIKFQLFNNLFNYHFYAIFDK